MVCLVTAAFAAMLTYENLPKVERVKSMHAMRVGWLKNEYNRVIEMGKLKPGPWNNFGKENVEDVKEKMVSEIENYKNELANLPKERRESVTWAVNIWLCFSIGLYVAGWLGVRGWVDGKCSSLPTWLHLTRQVLWAGFDQHASWP
ncbi:hypothetical protein BK664_06865 [Pseudomonas brassicacearum]|uniref:Uncharacterized protein n=1 Tax=Pseudomonas brassicacearum TaxID=930166 RepID=A0A423JRE6_9PSED|nr:hypothetical protein BK664_06865 [Pseudomonas brassicacearum]